MARTTLCNICGEDLRYDHTNFNITYDYGYDSNHEGSKLELDLCEKCLEKITQYLLSSCKINPLVSSYM